MGSERAHQAMMRFALNPMQQADDDEQHHEGEDDRHGAEAFVACISRTAMTLPVLCDLELWHLAPARLECATGRRPAETP